MIYLTIVFIIYIFVMDADLSDIRKYCLFLKFVKQVAHVVEIVKSTVWVWETYAV